MTREEAILCLKGIKNLGHDMFTEQKDFQECLDMAIKALEIVKEVKQIVDEWDDKITEPEEDIYYLCHIEQLFEQKGE